MAEEVAGQRGRLLELARRWAADGIDLVQLREKHLEAGALLELAEEMLRVLHADGPARTKLLINGRVDVAVAAGADGVHLTSHPGELTPEQVRAVFAAAGRPAPIVSVSCHTLDEVKRTTQNGADYILFGPVFEKCVPGDLARDGVGTEMLHTACEAAAPIPVLALGGITPQTIPLCIESGAAGVAGIRLFHRES
jgi:thiamine-phosphate pyrophosphorylase